MLIDSHCHLDFDAFDGERDALTARAAAAGVTGMVTICTRVRQFERVRAVAARYPCVRCTVGTHPHNAGEEADVTADEIVALADDPLVAGIGEAGLDYHYDHAPRDVQAAVFRTNIEAARRTGLPLVIHARDADADVEAILREETKKGPFGFVLHCFSSGDALAHAGVELGGYVSFSGILTFKRSDSLRALAAALPLDRLLVETDAPYLAPVPNRGKRCEPAYTRDTAQALADARGASLEAIAGATTANARRLFRLPEGFAAPAVPAATGAA